jgi:AcrR family transcriptional regulator
MRAVVFVMTPSTPWTDGAFAVLLVRLRDGNRAAGVTGVLTRHHDRAVGVLEGDDDAVSDRLAHVRADPELGIVLVLSSEPTRRRVFPEWAAAYQQADPLLHGDDDVAALLSAPLAADPELLARRGGALLTWFRANQRAPLSAQHHTDSTSERVRIVNVAIEVLHETGIEDCSLELVADVASIDLAALLVHFPTRPDLVRAMIERWAGALSVPLQPITAELGAVAHLRALVRAHAEQPALMRLVASTLSASTSLTQPGGAGFRAMYSGFKAVVRDALEDDVRHGREPATTDPERGAQQLLALYDGLRLQALLDPGFDIVDAFDRATTGVRHGWAEPDERRDPFQPLPAIARP